MFNYIDYVLNQLGQPVSGASVTVYLTGTSTKATLYSDDGTTVKANPVTSGSDGKFSFYVEDGRYDLTVTGTGVTSATNSDIEIFDDKSVPTVMAHLMQGANMGAKILNAMDILVAKGGGEIDARGLYGVQTISDDMFDGVTVPGVLKLSPYLTASLSAEQGVPPNWAILGGHSGIRVDSAATAPGTVFTWAGAASKNMFKVYGAHNVEMAGLVLDAASGTDIACIYFDGINSPPGNDCYFHDMTLQNFKNGVLWGNGDVAAYQLDAATFRKLQFRSAVAGASGIVINGGNTAQGSVIDQCKFQAMKYGINAVKIGGLMTIRQCLFGTLNQSSAVDIWLQYVNDAIIEQCQGESGVKFIDVTGSGLTAGVINIKQCKFDEAVTVSRDATVISEGNYGSASATFNSTNGRLVSINDVFNSFVGWTVAGTTEAIKIGSRTISAANSNRFIMDTGGSEWYQLVGTGSGNGKTVTAGTLSNDVGTAFLIRDATGATTYAKVDTASLYLKGTIRDTGATATMGMTLKAGSGSGDYTFSTDTNYADVDATNLSYTVTIPAGWKLGIRASGSITTATAAVLCYVSLYDGATLPATERAIVPPGIGAAGWETFSIDSVINGDDASHTIKLQYKTTNTSDAVTIANSSATVRPSMVFTLMPSN